MSRLVESLDPTAFGGSTYDPKEDAGRLSRQLSRVRALMLDGRWRTLTEIAVQVGAPESSVSARLRDMRKIAFGGYQVDRRRAPDSPPGTYQYRVRL